MHCSHYTDLLVFSLNLDFDLFVSTRKYVSADFSGKLLRLLLLRSTVYFSYSAFPRIFSVSREGPDLGIFGEHKKGRYGGSNLGGNYNSANNTKKKGVS